MSFTPAQRTPPPTWLAEPPTPMPFAAPRARGPRAGPVPPGRAPGAGKPRCRRTNAALPPQPGRGGPGAVSGRRRGRRSRSRRSGRGGSPRPSRPRRPRQSRRQQRPPQSGRPSRRPRSPALQSAARGIQFTLVNAGVLLFGVFCAWPRGKEKALCRQEPCTALCVAQWWPTMQELIFVLLFCIFHWERQDW